MINRRFSPRFPLRREITLSLPEKATQPALLLDISLGGAGILVAFPATTGSTVYFNAQLPLNDSARDFSAQCRVATVQKLKNTESHLLGLEFMNISDLHRKHLAQFVRLY